VRAKIHTVSGFSAHADQSPARLARGHGRGRGPLCPRRVQRAGRAQIQAGSAGAEGDDRGGGQDLLSQKPARPRFNTPHRTTQGKDHPCPQTSKSSPPAPATTHRLCQGGPFHPGRPARLEARAGRAQRRRDCGAHGLLERRAHGAAARQDARPGRGRLDQGAAQLHSDAAGRHRRHY